MSVQVRFSLELLRACAVAVRGCAQMRIFALGIVGLHMRLPIVASLEQLSADSALMGSLLGRCPLALLLDTVDTW